MIHCPSCGKANADEFKFCLGCGVDLASARSFASENAHRAHYTDGDGPGAREELPRVPPPPRTPSRRALGIIYAYTGSQAVKRLLGGIFSVVGLGLFGVLGYGLVLDVAIMASGKRSDGVVVGVATDYSTEINGRHPREITFAFGANNAHRGRSSTTDLAFADSLRPGQPVQIEAVPGYPAAARVRGTMRSALGWFGLFPLLFAFVGLPLLVSAVRSNRREIRAFRFGVAGVGRVTRFGADHSVKLNGRHPTVLAWEIDVDGKLFQGSITHMDGLVLKPLVVGMKVAVVYDRNDPKTNTVYVP